MTLELTRLMALLVLPACEIGKLDAETIVEQFLYNGSTLEGRLLFVKMGVEELRQCYLSQVKNLQNPSGFIDGVEASNKANAYLAASRELLEWRQELELDLVTGWTGAAAATGVSVERYVEIQESTLARFRSAWVKVLASEVRKGREAFRRNVDTREGVLP